MDRSTVNSAGIIVFRKNEPETEVLLISGKGKRYSFPKGHMEVNESEEQTAVREVLEETGITARILPGFRGVVPSCGKDDNRDIVFFLGEYQYGEVIAQKSEVISALWYPVDKISELKFFPPDYETFLAAWEVYHE